jgi:hypothetical protein
VPGRVEVRDRLGALAGTAGTDDAGRWKIAVPPGDYDARGVVQSGLMCPVIPVHVDAGATTSTLTVECFGK